MEVFAISLITNLATGLTDEVLTHGAVTNVANDSGASFVQFMTEFMSQLSDKPYSHPVTSHSNLLDLVHSNAQKVDPIPILKVEPP